MKLTLDRMSPYLAKSLGLSEEEVIGCFRPATHGDFEQVVALRRALFSGTAPLGRLCLSALAL